MVFPRIGCYNFVSVTCKFFRKNDCHVGSQLCSMTLKEYYHSIRNISAKCIWLPWVFQELRAFIFVRNHSHLSCNTRSDANKTKSNNQLGKIPFTGTYPEGQLIMDMMISHHSFPSVIICQFSLRTLVLRELYFHQLGYTGYRALWDE